MGEESVVNALTYVVSTSLFIGALAAIFGVWNRTAPKAALEATASRVEELAAGLGQVEDRVVKLEAQIVHMPTKDDVHNLDRGLIHLTGIVEQQGERTLAIVRSLDRVENYLFQQPAPPMTTPDRNHA